MLPIFLFFLTSFDILLANPILPSVTDSELDFLDFGDDSISSVDPAMFEEAMCVKGDPNVKMVRRRSQVCPPGGVGVPVAPTGWRAPETFTVPTESPEQVRPIGFGAARNVCLDPLRLFLLTCSGPEIMYRPKRGVLLGYVLNCVVGKFGPDPTMMEFKLTGSLHRCTARDRSTQTLGRDHGC